LANILRQQFSLHQVSLFSFSLTARALNLTHDEANQLLSQQIEVLC
jgi:hypothetical protein